LGFRRVSAVRWARGKNEKGNGERDAFRWVFREGDARKVIRPMRARGPAPT
jgi:hypothetical protein